MYVVVAHAPCVTAERSIDQVKQWWANFADRLGDISNGNMVVLIDANAPLAEDEPKIFGQHHAERMNQQGFEFQDFLVSKELYAPSTFSWHDGPSATWQHPRGDQFRRDYVILSRSLFTICARSFVIGDFDGGFAHIDHCPAVCELKGIVGETAYKEIQMGFSQDAGSSCTKSLCRSCRVIAPAVMGGVSGRPFGIA